MKEFRLKQYSTISKEAVTSLLTINKSKFVGYITNIDTVQKASEIVQEIKSKYPDATHHCYAYIIGKNKDNMKYNDDGEPSGTAGVPMLEVLKKSGLTDIIVVITRYFGGIKLGSGGLIRAYSQSVSETLKKTQIIDMVPYNIYHVKVPYDIWSKIENKAIESHCLINHINYYENIELEIGLKQEDFKNARDIFCSALKTDDALTFYKQDYIQQKSNE